MAHWDVFHSSRLELERGLTPDALRAAVARGDVVDDDLVRVSGSGDPWTRLVDAPEILAAAEPARAGIEVEDEDEEEIEVEIDEGDDVVDPGFSIEDDEDESYIARPDYVTPPTGINPLIVAEHDVYQPPVSPAGPAAAAGEPYGEFDLDLRKKPPAPAASDPPSAEIERVYAWDDGLDAEYDPLEEDEAVAEFTLSRGAADRVEELDLAAMVDVAFQLVLFFLVTATTVLYKTLEVPKPNPEAAAPAAAAQGNTRTIDDLKDDFILVEIDPLGVLKVDHEPVRAEMNVLTERLRSERERTGRKSMLLSADFATPHKNAVLAYDAANEIGLGIAIARPTPPAGQ